MCTPPLPAPTHSTISNNVHSYARTSIKAAKRNAQKHREADGGQIDWRNESLRRHGVIEPPETQNSVKQLLGVGTEKASVAKYKTGELKVRKFEEEMVKDAVRHKGQRE